MIDILFGAFILVYGLLTISHLDANGRSYRLFAFGFLISLLYAIVYAVRPDTIPVMMLVLTSLAILTQYFHIRAVDSKRVKGTKMLVNVTKHGLVKSSEKNKPHRYKF